MRTKVSPLFLSPFDIFIFYYFSGTSDHTSLCESEDEKPKAVDPDDEEAEVVDTKTPAKKPKRRSSRKSTAVTKEAKEAKEAVVATKSTPGWATTFTLDGIQYVLKDAAGHPVSFPFIFSFSSLTHNSFSDRRQQGFHGPCSWSPFQCGTSRFHKQVRTP